MYSSDDERPVALVTGAAYGIGLAIVKRLLDDGYRIAATAEVPPDRAEAAAAAVGRPMLAMTEDFTDPSNATECVERTVDRFGRINVLVNNAGITLTRPLVDTTDAQMSSLFNVNVLAALHASRAAIPHLSKGGTIVMMSSVHGLSGQHDHVVYAATKAALIGAVRALADEVGPDIRAVAVAPGFVKVEKNAGFDYATATTSVPLRRAAEPEEVAALVSWLVGPEARYVTGAVYQLDGGLVGRMGLGD